MAVYALCEKCGGKTRRERCPTPNTHKRFTAWVADWQPTRQSKRLSEVFGSDLANPKELAEDRLSTWKTDRKRGALGFANADATAITFETAADEWWTNVVIGKNQIKDPRRSEWSRLGKCKAAFGKKLLSNVVPDGKAEREDYMTRDTAEKWIVERREQGIKAGTINRDLKTLRWILQYAVDSRYIKENPLEGLKGIKGERVHDRWMTQEEIDALVKAAYALNDEGLVDFIAIGVNTGFRLGNLLRLTARDIDGNLLMAQQTKSGTPYSVPISPDIEPLLRRLAKENPTGPLLKNTWHIGLRFREAAKKAGLYNDKDDNDRVTIHTLRHTFAVLYLKRGGDIYKLSKLLGHASVGITDKIYARFCPKEKMAQALFMSTPIQGVEQPRLKVI